MRVSTRHIFKVERLDAEVYAQRVVQKATVWVPELGSWAQG